MFVKSSTCLKDPAKYYYRVICSTWNNKNEPGVLIYSKKEWFKLMQEKIDEWKNTNKYRIYTSIN